MVDDHETYRNIKNAWKGKGGATDGTRFKLTRFSETPWSPSTNYLIKDLIPREGLVVIWGPPKSGKSFWAWDALMHVALGWDYRDRRIAAGPVVYLACEGERGLSARAEAFRRKHGLATQIRHFSSLLLVST